MDYDDLVEIWGKNNNYLCSRSIMIDPFFTTRKIFYLFRFDNRLKKQRQFLYTNRVDD